MMPCREPCTPEGVGITEGEGAVDGGVVEGVAKGACSLTGILGPESLVRGPTGTPT